MSQRKMLADLLYKTGEDTILLPPYERYEQAVALADHLIANGVTILPEGAIILTKEEIAALNEYQRTRGDSIEK